MNYAAEDLIRALKAAREGKGLTQRDLSIRTGIPQSHISKIESGGTDVRLSSLVELARNLDLEITLVPRRAVPAVDTIVRSTALASPMTPAEAGVLRDFVRTLEAVKDVQALYPDASAVREAEDGLRALQNLMSAGRSIWPSITSVREFFSRIQERAEQVREAADTFKPLPPDVIRTFKEAGEAFRQIREQVAQAAPTATLPRPAYQLDDDEEDARG